MIKHIFSRILVVLIEIMWRYGYYRPAEILLNLFGQISEELKLLCAYQLIRDRKFEEAIILYLETMTSANLSVRRGATWALANLYFSQDEYEKALQYLEHYDAIAPNESPAIALIGLCQLELGLSQGSKTLMRARELDKGNPDAVWGLYRLEDLADNHDGAQSILVRYTEDAPYMASSWGFLARYFANDEGDYGKAIPLYEMALETLEGRRSKAYSESLSIYDSTREFRRQLVWDFAWALYECGREGEATALVSSRMSSSEAVRWKCEMHRRNREFEKGRLEMLRRIRKSPNEATNHYFLGYLELVAGNYSKAIRHLVAYLQLSDRQGLGIEIAALALIHVAIAKTGQTVEMGIAKRVESAFGEEEFLIRLAWIYFELQDWEGLIECGKQANDKGFHSPGLESNLAEANIALGNYQQARRLLEELNETQPNNSRTRILICEVLIRLEEYKGATDIIQQIANTNCLSKPLREKIGSLKEILSKVEISEGQIDANQRVA